jgi:hypothetical protein
VVDPESVRIVIDHVSGSRRGQRQELPGDAKVRFGRHPECEVSFDAHRDIDASSRHAELRHHGDRWVLVDVGSSNGTYVDGKRITEAPVSPGVPVMVDFGPTGPKLRLFIGDDDQVVRLAAPPVEAPPARRTWLVAAVVALLVAVGVAALVLAL